MFPSTGITHKVERAFLFVCFCLFAFLINLALALVRLNYTVLFTLYPTDFVDGSSFEGLAWEPSCHLYYGFPGGKNKMHSESQLTSPGKPETHLPFFSDPCNGYPLSSPHCFHITDGREKWYSGPHSCAGYIGVGAQK